MSENAELWVYADASETHIKNVLCNWLKAHNVDFDSDMTNEELRQLYIAKETGKI
jgi:hypothetical protein